MKRLSTSYQKRDTNTALQAQMCKRTRQLFSFFLFGVPDLLYLKGHHVVLEQKFKL